MAALTSTGDWMFGVQLPIQTLTRTLVDPWEDTATVADLVTIAQAADQHRFDFVGVCDHIAIPDNDYAAKMTTTWYDTISTLSYLAAVTEHTRLLSVVWIAAYRHPLQTAKAFGTLDHLSGGRAVLGVGAGHVQAEFDALGVDFATRGKRLDETLEAVRGAFVDTYVSHDGERFQYDSVGVAPRPVQDELPIWIGGAGTAAWRRTGRIGDGYIPMGLPIEQYPDAIEVMREAAIAAGRPADVPLDIGYMTPWGYLLGDPPDGIGMHWLQGGVEGLAADIRAAREVGCNVMHLKFRARDAAEYVDSLAAFAEQVVPLVNEG
ncbi:MAG: TIGR03619 family F420-dependent LLM class oxidoreductase [Actinomycetota bacterium]